MWCEMEPNMCSAEDGNVRGSVGNESKRCVRGRGGGRLFSLGQGVRGLFLCTCITLNGELRSDDAFLQARGSRGAEVDTCHS